jgi:diguanylate cyclase (GGDEF)-like protein
MTSNSDGRPRQPRQPRRPAARAAKTGDATLSVARAALVLGVHPNTVRAWSDAGRLRCYRINERGDRRYRVADLQRFLTSAAAEPLASEQFPSRSRHRETAGATLTATPAGLELLADLAEIASFPSGVDTALDEACRRIRTVTSAALVGVWEQRPGGLVARAAATEGGWAAEIRRVPPDRSPLLLALAGPEPVHARPGMPGPMPVLGLGTDELAVAIPGGETPWGVLVMAGAVELGPDDGRRLALAIARTLATLVHGAWATEQATARLRRSEALRRVSTDLASRLDVDGVAQDLGDHARVLFGADRVAIVLHDGDRRVITPPCNGFSEAFLDQARQAEEQRLGQRDVPPRRPVLLAGPDLPRAASALRAAALAEGVDTLLVAPLIEGHQHHGSLYLAHDRPHRWRQPDLDAAETLAGDAAIAVRSARTFGRMAAWAAQLQAIQRLGARLSGLSDVAHISNAIATELRELIEYDTARVYRVRDAQLVPVAWQGLGATFDAGAVAAMAVPVGEGIPGWVARYRVPQIVDDVAADARAMRTPGAKPDAPQSMLLAPMIHEGMCLGVVVLAYAGTRHFTDDDLRLLAIYASFAAQAMASADATERLQAQSVTLERRLRAQHELLRTTEDILTILDRGTILDQITDRLWTLIRCDNLSIEVVDAVAGILVPISARGVSAPELLKPWLPGEQGIAPWAVQHNQSALIEDEWSDPRVYVDPAVGPVDGSLIVVPLLGGAGGTATGVLTVERLGLAEPFGEEEFDLVKLFAAQVSIALRNAQTLEAAEVRARTDPLTGLLNRGAFTERLTRAVLNGEPFGLVMIDLDEFGSYNKALGHQAGDRLLREISASIPAAARDTDAVFRYGGDEFAVLLPWSDGSGLRQVGERIEAAITQVGAQGSVWAAGGFHVSASIGTAAFPVDGDTAETVLLAADRACCVAKRRGRGLVAVADEGLELAAEFVLSEPTPVDPPAPEHHPA